MNSEHLDYLIGYMLDERGESIDIPVEYEKKFDLYRALANIRQPEPVSEEYLSIQDAFLRELRLERGSVLVEQCEIMEPGIRLWRGDITRLAVDAIVNAANSALLGCFAPLHECIDNCIHTYAGVQLRLKCNELMRGQKAEPTGRAKITPAYNLPSRYVLHTVGPIINGELTKRDEALLCDCYAACIALAVENNCRSLAFCCISTGVFRFPPYRAAELAVSQVRQLRPEGMEVVFNVFSQRDEAIYRSVMK